MNKHIKLHKFNSPAFRAGEVWVSASGSKVVITKVEPWPICDGKWNYNVFYTQENGSMGKKELWGFQVRYTHQSDIIASGKE